MIMKTKYLVESCLLTHGLRSITDGEVIRAWDGVNATFAWIDEGKIQTGCMDATVFVANSGLLSILLFMNSEQQIMVSMYL